MNIAELAQFLQTYSGRDKVIRTLCYSSKLASGVIHSEPTSSKLNAFSSQLSACRALLRLFDDVPMLNCTLSYGLGKQEQDKVLRTIGVLSNVIDQVYYPIEHIAWAAENKYITLRNNPFETLCTVFWVVSIYLSLMRAVRCVAVMQYHKSCLKGVDCDVSHALTQLITQQRGEILAAVRSCFDLVHAISCLPTGWMWGGKLVRWQVGALGTISSILGLYMALSKRNSS